MASKEDCSPLVKDADPENAAATPEAALAAAAACAADVDASSFPPERFVVSKKIQNVP